MLMDRWNKILLSTAFLLLLVCIGFSEFFRPMTETESAVVLFAVFELAAAALFRRIVHNRTKNKSTGLFYFKAAWVLFFAVWILMRTILILIS